MPVGCIALASSESVKSITPEMAPASISRSIAGPPTPLAWKTTGAWPAASSCGQHPHHRRGGVAEHGDANAVLAQALHGPARIASHSHHGRGGVVEHGARDRVDPEDVGDRVHDEGVALADERAEGRRPEALGDTISLGTPTGRPATAAAPSRAPSAPPRHSTPSSRPSSHSRSTTARTPSLHLLDGRAARTAARTASSSLPAARATSARDTSGSQPAGSPRMPESITTVAPPSARIRSRT